MHHDDPYQKNPDPGSKPESSKDDFPLEEVNLRKMDFAPGEIRLVPDPGMVLPLGRYTLVDFIDGSLITRTPAPYDESATLIDVSELVSLVNRLDSASISLLGGAITKEIYPPGWAQSIDDINLAFGEHDDPLSRSSFEEVGSISSVGGENRDSLHYAIKLGRFVESIRELHEYMDHQRSLGGGSEHHADIDRLDMFLSQAMGRAYARFMNLSSL
jgi:hypothetical protein